MRLAPSRAPGALLTTLLAPAVACGQPCEPEWIAVGGPDKDVWAMTVWDPDGPGPAPARLVVGGAFKMVGGQAVSGIAAWDPVSGEWSALAEGVRGTVRALATLPNGDLVAGGLFSHAGGVEAAHIARWDGERWHAMGAGMTGEWLWPLPAVGVYALAVLPSGDLVAGGNFGAAGGVAAESIARWDGEAWRPMGEDLWLVLALTVAPGGDLIAGGDFGEPSTPPWNIARWDGAEWTALGAGVGGGLFDTPNGPFALAIDGSGAVIAGGHFTLAGGEPAVAVARWDGAVWDSMQGGMSSALFPVVNAVQSLPSGDVIVGGEFDRAGGPRGVPALNVARWDGDAWHPLGEGLGGGVHALASLPGGDLAVGGRFGLAGGLESPYFAIWGCAPCYADCDGSGALDFFDFLCFQELFAAGDPQADCDGSGEIDFIDFLCFQNAFAAGCA